MNRINPENDETILPPESTCPYCNTKLPRTAGLGDAEGKKPQPGDILLCANCGEPCQFGYAMEMLKLTDKLLKEVLQDPALAKAISFIKQYKNRLPQKVRYEAQLDKMLADVKAWLKTGDWNPSIQYNFTSQACVIACLDDALDKHFISVNDDALIMFQSLGWLDDKPSMPTVLMVKVVMENVFKE